MSKVEQIEIQIKELSSAELAAFRQWFSEFDSRVWDRQFEADVKAGKLHKFADRGRCGTTLPGNLPSCESPRLSRFLGLLSSTSGLWEFLKDEELRAGPRYNHYDFGR